MTAFLFWFWLLLVFFCFLGGASEKKEKVKQFCNNKKAHGVCEQSKLMIGLSRLQVRLVFNELV